MHSCKYFEPYPDCARQSEFAPVSLAHDRLTGMRATLWSYWPVGIEAVPVQARVNGDRASVVEPLTDWVVYSIRPHTTS